LIKICGLKRRKGGGHEVDDAEVELVAHELGEIEHAEFAGGGIGGEVLAEGAGGDADLAGEVLVRFSRVAKGGYWE
jgi:hypothetical protein